MAQPDRILGHLPGLAGWAAGVPEQTARAAGFSDATPGASHLVPMWVSPRARGQGIAGDLVESVCRWARADGATKVERQLVRPGEPDHWEEQLSASLARQTASQADSGLSLPGWRAARAPASRRCGGRCCPGG